MNTARDIQDGRFVDELARFRPYGPSRTPVPTKTTDIDEPSEDKTPQAAWQTSLRRFVPTKTTDEVRGSEAFATEGEIYRAMELTFGGKDMPRHVSTQALMNIMRYICKREKMPYRYTTNLKDGKVRKAYEEYRAKIGEPLYPLSDEQRMEFDFQMRLDSAESGEEKARLLQAKAETAKAMELYRLLKLWELRMKS